MNISYNPQQEGINCCNSAQTLPERKEQRSSDGHQHKHGINIIIKQQFQVYESPYEHGGYPHLSDHVRSLSNHPRHTREVYIDCIHPIKNYHQPHKF